MDILRGYSKAHVKKFGDFYFSHLNLFTSEEIDEKKQEYENHAKTGSVERDNVNNPVNDKIHNVTLESHSNQNSDDVNHYLRQAKQLIMRIKVMENEKKDKQINYIFKKKRKTF